MYHNRQIYSYGKHVPGSLYEEIKIIHENDIYYYQTLSTTDRANSGGHKFPIPQETEGKIFCYYNSFCCPHCGTPYIDYKKYPDNNVFGVSGCVHLGRKTYSDK